MRLSLLQATSLSVGVIGFLLFTTSAGIIQIHYPRAVNNNPLIAPVMVESVSGDTLVLEDGRIFQVDVFGEPLDQIIQESGYLVDIESEDDGAYLSLYASRRGWICGTPWAAMIEIPLIPDDIPINRREYIGFANQMSFSSAAEE